MAVFFLDVNDFRSINERFGHHVGDQLLTTLGRRLQQSAGPGRGRRAARRRRVRGAGREGRRARRRRGAGRALPRRARPADDDRRRDGLAHRQRRHRAEHDGGRAGRARASRRRPRHGAREARRTRRERQPPRRVRLDDRRRSALAPAAAGRAAPRRAGRRVRPALPPDDLARDRPDHRRRGPAPLAASDARTPLPVRLPHRRRGARHHHRRRPLGDPRGVPAGRRVDGARFPPASGSPWPSTSRRASS